MDKRAVALRKEILMRQSLYYKRGKKKQIL